MDCASRSLICHWSVGGVQQAINRFVVMLAMMLMAVPTFAQPPMPPAKGQDLPKGIIKPPEGADDPVPEKGTALEYRQYMEKIMDLNRGPVRLSVLTRLLRASDIILADPKAEAELLDDVRQLKLNFLFRAAQLDAAQYRPKLAEFQESVLKLAPGSELAAMAEGYRIVVDFYRGKEMALEAADQIFAHAERYPQSNMGIDLMTQLVLACPDDRQALDWIKRATAIYKTHPRKDQLSEEQTNREMAGTKIEFAGVTADGKKLTSQELLGKVIILDFWASTSEPNLGQMAFLGELHHNLSDRGLVILGVNLDRSPAMLRDYLAKQPLAWPTLTASKPEEAGYAMPLAVKFRVFALPVRSVIGRDGRLIARSVSIKRLEDVVLKALAEPAKAATATP